MTWRCRWRRQQSSILPPSLRRSTKPLLKTIDNDVELSAKRDLLVSVNGVGEALAGIVLAEFAGSRYPRLQRRGHCLRRVESAATPVRNLRSTGPCGSPQLAMPCFAHLCTCRLCRRCVTTQRSLLWSIGSRLRAASRKADCDRCHAQTSGALLRSAEDRQGIRPGDGDG